MQIIIVGCGKVGRTLAEQLQEEDTDLTLIDISADKINSISDDIDALYVIGNGASINTLMEAGIETADLLIAVTASDEPDIATPLPVYVILSTVMRSASLKNVSVLP